MIYTTLNKIREHSPCHEGWTKLLKHLGKTKGDDEPLALSAAGAAAWAALAAAWAALAAAIKAMGGIFLEILDLEMPQ